MPLRFYPDFLIVLMHCFFPIHSPISDTLLSHPFTATFAKEQTRTNMIQKVNLYVATIKAWHKRKQTHSIYVFNPLKEGNLPVWLEGVELGSTSPRPPPFKGWPPLEKDFFLEIVPFGVFYCERRTQVSFIYLFIYLLSLSTMLIFLTMKPVIYHPNHHSANCMFVTCTTTPKW